MDIGTYYWPSMSTDFHVRRVSTCISSRLLPFVVEVALVDKRIMRLKLKHTLTFMALAAMCAPTEKLEIAKMFHAKLGSVLYQ